MLLDGKSKYNCNKCQINGIGTNISKDFSGS